MLFVLTRGLKTVVILLTLASLVAFAQQPLSAKQKQDIALWENLQSDIEVELARHQMVCDPASNWKVSVIPVVDLTGDGVPEAVVNWCNGGAYTDSIILMRLERGRPVLARSRENGGYGYLELASGTSAMHSAGYEFHAEQHAVYTIELDIGGWTEKSVAKDVTAHVRVYVWNPKTKTFDLNRKLSKQESAARTDKKPRRRSRLISVTVRRPNIVVRGAFLSEVNFWAISTGTGIAEAGQQTLIGEARRVTPAGSNEKWIFQIPPCTTAPILATRIFAQVSNDHGWIGNKSLPYSGVSEINEALCGKRD